MSPIPSAGPAEPPGLPPSSLQHQHPQPQSAATTTHKLSTAISQTFSRLGLKIYPAADANVNTPPPLPPLPTSPPAATISSNSILESTSFILPELRFSPPQLMPRSTSGSASASPMRASLVTVKGRKSTTRLDQYGADGVFNNSPFGTNQPADGARERERNPHKSTPSVITAKLIGNDEAVSTDPRYVHLGTPPAFRLSQPDREEISTEDAHSLLTPVLPAAGMLQFPDEVWRNIVSMLDAWDLSRLSRCSKALRTVLDPHLYTTVKLAPSHPHNFSYFHLSVLLQSLTIPENDIKLRQFTKSFIVTSGWEENAIGLYDRGEFLMTDDVRDEFGQQVVAPERVVELIEEEGPVGDGGVREVNILLAEFLLHANGLVKFVWDSPIPMRGALVATIAKVASLRRVDLNLAQPTRLQRKRGDWKVIEKAVLAKYRPPVDLLGALPLVELKLANLPTRGGEWWVGVWYLIKSLRSLKVLKVEMPNISRARYPGLFDEEGWMSGDAVARKMPPLWGGCVTGLERLEISGFIVDAAAVGGVAKLSLKGCMRKDSAQQVCWPPLKYFCTSGWAFVGIGLQSNTITNPTLKELHILPSVDQLQQQQHDPLLPAPRIVNAAKQLFMTYLPIISSTIQKLSLPPDWHFSAPEISPLLRACRNVTHLSLTIDEEIWDTFIENLPAMQNISEIHVANEGPGRVGAVVGRLMEVGIGRVGQVVRVGVCGYRIALVGDVFGGWKWGIERVGEKLWGGI